MPPPKPELVADLSVSNRQRVMRHCPASVNLEDAEIGRGRRGRTLHRQRGRTAPIDCHVGIQSWQRAGEVDGADAAGAARITTRNVEVDRVRVGQEVGCIDGFTQGAMRSKTCTAIYVISCVDRERRIGRRVIVVGNGERGRAWRRDGGTVCRI